MYDAVLVCSGKAFVPDPEHVTLVAVNKRFYLQRYTFIGVKHRLLPEFYRILFENSIF